MALLACLTHRSNLSNQNLIDEFRLLHQTYGCVNRRGNTDLLGRGGMFGMHFSQRKHGFTRSQSKDFKTQTLQIELKIQNESCGNCSF